MKNISIKKVRFTWNLTFGEEKTATGYKRITSVYECAGCKGCPYKTQCIKGNNSKTPMEDRVKRLYVSKTMKEQRKKDLECITGEYGTQLKKHVINRRLIYSRTGRFKI